MRVETLQLEKSHASCVAVVTLASKALMDKLPASADEREKLELSDEEIKLLNKVIDKFGRNPAAG
jgi:hypothetical protein